MIAFDILAVVLVYVLVAVVGIRVIFFDKIDEYRRQKKVDHINRTRYDVRSHRRPLFAM